jgi:hypothetical protein
MSSDNEGLTIPSHKVTIDHQGRVIIDDPSISAKIKDILSASDPGDHSVGNMRLDGNVACANVVLFCQDNVACANVLACAAREAKG